MASYSETVNYDSDCDLDIPQEFEGVQLVVKSKIEKAQIHSGYHRLNAGLCIETSSADIIVDTQPILPVKRLIWRSVRHQSSVTFVYGDEEENNANKEKQVNATSQEAPDDISATSLQSNQILSAIIEMEELTADSGDAESTEQAVEKMNQLLKNQVKTMAPKYQDIIRESAEFAIDDVDCSEDEEEDECYESLKR